MIDQAFIFGRVVPGLTEGLWVSVQLIVPSALLGVVMGIVTGAVRVYGPGWLKRLANAYVAVFRGTPLVVQLYFWYFALPYAALGSFRIVLEPVQASILGFIMCTAAYQSEYIRGGAAVHQVRADQGRPGPGHGAVQDPVHGGPAPGRAPCASRRGQRDHLPHQVQLPWPPSSRSTS